MASSRLPSRPDRAEPALSIWFPRARTVAIQEESVPATGPEEVRVRALVSALSHGTEMLVYRGQVPPDLPLDLPTLSGGFGFPIKYGYASVGRVRQVGEGVTHVAVGDLVFVLHPHQTEYVAPASLVVRLPPDLDPELGVFTANLETAVNVLLDANPRLGERVVIFGQGVVGLLLTQLFRRAGASRVVVVDPMPRRRALARQLGADLALAPDDDVEAAVRDLTDGVGADLAVEASGNGAALAPALACVAFQGTVVVSSWYGTKPVSAPLGGPFHRRRLHIVSSQVGTIDPALQARWTHVRRLALTRDYLSLLWLSPLISHRFPLVDAAQAYALVDERPGETVQVLLTYDP